MASTAISTTNAASALASSNALAGSITTRDTSDNSGKDAIASCMRSWNYAHKKRAGDKNPTSWECEKAGNKAYLRATPPLCGYQNICDFIACINYASMTGIVTHNDASHYLANAKLALSAIYHQPKPAAASTDQPDSTGSEDESPYPGTPKSLTKGGN